MGNCARIKPRAAKTCIGNMRSFITFYKKTKQATNATAIDPNLNLEPIVSMWAMQKSANGEEVFDGVNMIGKITDHFYIRYDSIKVNKTYILEFAGNFYEIVEVIPNLEGKYETIVLKCSIRGDSSLINTRI
jgi:hypothetical protein